MNEDVFPIQHANFPMPCYFSDGNVRTLQGSVQFKKIGSSTWIFCNKNKLGVGKTPYKSPQFFRWSPLRSLYIARVYPTIPSIAPKPPIWNIPTWPIPRHRLSGMQASRLTRWHKKADRFLVGGWTNQVGKICSSKWVHLPQSSGWKFHFFLKPPSSFLLFVHSDFCFFSVLLQVCAIYGVSSLDTANVVESMEHLYLLELDFVINMFEKITKTMHTMKQQHLPLALRGQIIYQKQRSVIYSRLKQNHRPHI